MKSHRVVALLLALLVSVAFAQNAHAINVLQRLEVTASPWGPGNFMVDLIHSFTNLLPSFDPNESAIARFARCQAARAQFNESCPADVTAFNFDQLVDERMATSPVSAVSGFGDHAAGYRNCITATDGTVWINSRETCMTAFIAAVAPLCNLTPSYSSCAFDLLARVNSTWESGAGLADMPTTVRLRAFAVEICRELAARVDASCES
jgi:hypothetical protein